MAGTQSYDYSLTEHHVEPFQYANPNTAFLEEDADSYGDLWQFKPHVTRSPKNNEGKWRLRPTELRMEFYLNILQDFAATSENVLAVFVGRKFMLAAKV